MSALDAFFTELPVSCRKGPAAIRCAKCRLVLHRQTTLCYSFYMPAGKANKQRKKVYTVKEQTEKTNRRVETPEAYKARRYAQRRAWAKANPEKTRSYGRKHYKKNAAKRIASSIAYYQSHKAERAAYSKEYYRRKKEEDPLFFKRNSERAKERKRIWRARQKALHPYRPPRPKRSELEIKIRHCFRTLNQYVFAAMGRDRAACGERVDDYMKRYPFEQYAERVIRVKIARFGVCRHNGEYDDCYDAGMLAYLYTMHRCAALNCDYVIPYLLKMIRIYILCALVIYHDSHNFCRINNLKQLRIDKDGAQRYIGEAADIPDGLS